MFIPTWGFIVVNIIISLLSGTVGVLIVLIHIISKSLNEQGENSEDVKNSTM